MEREHTLLSENIADRTDFQGSYVQFSGGGFDLVLRPSHYPVFDCLHYAKTERGDPVHFVTSMTSCVLESGGISDQKNAFYTYILCPEQEVVHFRFISVQNSSAWDRNHAQVSSFSVYLGRN